MRVWLVQYAASLDIADNLGTTRRLLTSAFDAHSAAGGDRVVVLPEGAMHDFGRPDLPLGPVAQPLDGPYVADLAQLAVTFSATVVAGMFESSDDPQRPYNTLVLLDPAGSLVAHYRKTHLFDSFGYRESDRLRPGSGEPVVVPIGDLTLGLMTCYDLRFPEQARALVDAGADTLVVPAAWVAGPLKEEHWTTLLRARAIENTVYVLGAGQSGPTYTGLSMVVDPQGVVLAGAGTAEAVVVGDLNASVIEQVRRRNPSLANRRGLSK